MSNAWETTEDDVLNVIHDMGHKANHETVERIHNDLNQFEIECEALRGIDIETQTDYAYEEIKRQITERNLL